MFRLNNNLTLSDLVIKYDCVSQSLDQSTFSDLTKLLQVVVTSSCLFFFCLNTTAEPKRVYSV